jgi:hypothetical protein
LYFSALATTPLTATAAMPGATMRIYAGEPVDGRVAESVKIGDPLTLVVGIDQQVDLLFFSGFASFSFG